MNLKKEIEESQQLVNLSLCKIVSKNKRNLQVQKREEIKEYKKTKFQNCVESSKKEQKKIQKRMK